MNCIDSAEKHRKTVKTWPPPPLSLLLPLTFPFPQDNCKVCIESCIHGLYKIQTRYTTQKREIQQDSDTLCQASFATTFFPPGTKWLVTVFSTTLCTNQSGLARIAIDCNYQQIGSNVNGLPQQRNNPIQGQRVGCPFTNAGVPMWQQLSWGSPPPFPPLPPFPPFPPLPPPFGGCGRNRAMGSSFLGRTRHRQVIAKKIGQKVSTNRTHFSPTSAELHGVNEEFLSRLEGSSLSIRKERIRDKLHRVPGSVHDTIFRGIKYSRRFKSQSETWRLCRNHGQKSHLHSFFKLHGEVEGVDRTKYILGCTERLKKTRWHKQVTKAIDRQEISMLVGRWWMPRQCSTCFFSCASPAAKTPDYDISD